MPSSIFNRNNAGRRVELIYCDDQYTKLRPGAAGTYLYSMDGPGCVQHTIKWDDGSSLMMIEGHDSFKFTTPPVQWVEGSFTDEKCEKCGGKTIWVCTFCNGFYCTNCQSDHKHEAR